MNSKTHMTATDAAKKFNVARVTIYDWCAKGKLRHYRTVGGYYCIERSSVDELFEAEKAGKLSREPWKPSNEAATATATMDVLDEPLDAPTLHDNWIALGPDEYPSAKLYAGMIVAFLENCEKLTLGEREAVRGLLFPNGGK